MEPLELYNGVALQTEVLNSAHTCNTFSLCQCQAKIASCFIISLINNKTELFFCSLLPNCIPFFEELLIDVLFYFSTGIFLFFKLICKMHFLKFNTISLSELQINNQRTNVVSKLIGLNFNCMFCDTQHTGVVLTWGGSRHSG